MEEIKADNTKFVNTLEEATHVGLIFYTTAEGANINNPPKDLKHPSIVDSIFLPKDKFFSEGLPTIDIAIMAICQELYFIKKLDLALGLNLFIKYQYFHIEKVEIIKPENLNKEALDWLMSKVKTDKPEAN
jgi:hypothetical protein